MLRPRTLHFLLTLIIIAVCLGSACSYCGVRPPAPGNSVPVAIPTPASVLPFSTREPPVWQANIVISLPRDGAAAQGGQTHFTARDGVKRRIDYAVSEKETMSVIENGAVQTLVLREQKKCAPVDEAQGASPGETGEAFTDFLTTGWLAGKVPAKIESMGREEIGGVSLNKFRVRFDRPGDLPDASEALVWVDETIGMPVRTEMFSLVNNEPVRQLTIEFRELKLSVDAGVFDLPAGCRNVTAKEIRGATRN